MANKTAYVRRPEEHARGGDSFGSIWIVGAVALIALFTLFGLYMAHYSLTKRIDARAEQARKERAALQQKIAALQQELQQLRGGTPVATTGAAAPEPAEPPPAPAAAGDDNANADDADDADAEPTRVRVASVPAGARVMEGFRELGLTPLEVSLKPGESRQVSLQRAGYRARQVTLRPAKPKVTVRLARVPVRRARAKAKAKKKGEEDEDSPLFNPYD
jgi:hypothetical protein